MPISLSCQCGKALRVKDEFAGKKVRCPGCKEVMSIPLPEPEASPDDEALNMLLADDQAPATAAPKPALSETAFQDESTQRVPRKPSSPPKPVTIEQVSATPRRKRPNPMPRDYERPEPARSGLVINGSIITGCLMMLGAA